MVTQSEFSVSGRFALVFVCAALVAGRLTAEEKVSFTPVKVSWETSVMSYGVPISKEGWYVTVIPAGVSLEELTEATIKISEEEIAAAVIHVDEGQRLGLLSTERGSKSWGHFDLCRKLESEVGMMLHTITTGATCRSTVIGKDWSYRGSQLPSPLLRIRLGDTEHQCLPGTPLVNEKNKVVGLVAARDLAEPSEAHAVPSSQICKLIHEMTHFEKSGPIWIGLVFHNETSTPEVLEVKPDSPASTAGLEIGDVILSLNTMAIESLADLVEAIHYLPAEEKADLVILRGLEKVEIEIVPQFIASAP